MFETYPRPQLVRENWINLDGEWDFCFDDEEMGEVKELFKGFKDEMKITVPFTYETKKSGIYKEEAHDVVWYSKSVNLTKGDKSVFLNFEGVDYEATVWVNGYFAGSHVGAYSRFSLDITKYVATGENKIVLKAKDSVSCVQPRGKQRWKKENFGCWYVQATGIWKSVWIEERPACHIESIKITPDLDGGNAIFDIKLSAIPETRVELKVSVTLDGEKVSSYKVNTETQYTSVTVKVESGDEPWKVIPWSPENPKLYDAVVSATAEGKEDSVKTYFGMRKIEIKNGRIFLNGRELYQRLILDQGYWKDSGITPDGEADMEKDLELIKKAGFNGLRKHQKVEDERFLYLCDKMGILVWCEMPSQYTYNDDVVSHFTNQWMEIVKQNYSHPSIITWTAFNESWGIERVYNSESQQKFTEGIYYLTKAYDTMRPVIVNDGWEHTISDILTLHDYEEKGEVFAKRYEDKDSIVNSEILFNKERFAFAKGYEYKGQPVIISEYGGIAFTSGEGWGYGNQVKSEKEYLERYESITQAIKELPYNVGFCYTQVSDVQQEINGIVTMERTPKVSLEKLCEINKK